MPTSKHAGGQHSNNLIIMFVEYCCILPLYFSAVTLLKDRTEARRKKCLPVTSSVIW